MQTIPQTENEQPPACNHCGSISTYTKQKTMHLGSYCAGCDRWLTWLSQGRPISVMPFGMYRGEAIKNLPRDYVRWLLNNAHVGKSLRAALERVAA